ncbi:LTA synthase family protein [Paraflavitalea speifideaquila]|uniref:LTA synthase family protein n=1 Tax=Paraflavitalea speifideaquila TaxID=3076558 RepID=UPI0028EC3DB5|nr:sulfatase-like hydrolase/transferase [Paraflavitalea speifideiaquila]
MYNRITRNRFAFIWVIIGLYLILSVLTRIALLLITSSAGITIGQFAGLFFIGFVYDLAIVSFVIIPFVLHLWLQNEFIYRKGMLPVVSGVFIALLALLLFTNIIPKDFSPPLFTALIGYIIFRFGVYLFLFFMPLGVRQRWRTGVLYFGFVLVIFLLLLNAVSEFFFWQEFSTRYNFIAVDYLVYTTEVLGNITESYPIALIMTVLIVTAIALAFMSRRLIRNSVSQPLSFAGRTLLAVCLLAVPALVYVGMTEKWRHFSKNEYANSMAGNGLYEFALAFTQNELDFYKFYQTLPDTTAFALVKQQLQMPNTRFAGNDPYSIERDILPTGAERKLNVVLISVESFSADFMQAFGSTKNITPYLDSLARHSLFFTNLYASGTRTVRGLEALSLSIPPTPGQSIVKRPDNGGMFSLGSVLRSKGYTTQYIYGGIAILTI